MAVGEAGNIAVASDEMELHCHRCDATIKRDDSFCAVCGAPQLRFATTDEEPAEGESAGLPQPPEADLRGVDWRKAFRSALAIAVPVGVLTALPGVSLGFLIWVVGGSIVVIGRYRRRRPGARLDGRSGFRIGALTGLLAAYISAALVAVFQLIERYAMHLGPDLDKAYAERMEQSTAMVQTTAQTEAQLRAYLHFMLTPDGRAAMSLAGAVMTAVFMVLLAGIGGILGVRFFGKPRTA